MNRITALSRRETDVGRVRTAKKKVKQFGKLFGVPILFYKQFWSAQTILQTVWSAQTILQTV